VKLFVFHFLLVYIFGNNLSFAIWELVYEINDVLTAINKKISLLMSAKGLPILVEIHASTYRSSIREKKRTF